MPGLRSEEDYNCMHHQNTVSFLITFMVKGMCQWNRLEHVFESQKYCYLFLKLNTKYVDSNTLTLEAYNYVPRVF